MQEGRKMVVCVSVCVRVGLPAGERRDYGIGFAIKTSLTRQLVELPVGIASG